MSKTSFMYMVNHVFLPPKLPEGDDSDPTNSSALQSTVLRITEKFEDFVPSAKHGLVRSAVAMIRRMVQAQDQNGNVNYIRLEGVLQELSHSGPGAAVPIHTHSQNAGVLVYKSKDSISIESFELSPLNSAVMKSPGRLRRYFPGPAMAMNLETFCDEKLRTCFAALLHKLCHQRTPDTCPLVKKAGQSHEEPRDTLDPVYVTEFMSAFLGPVAKQVQDAPGVWKNTRSEVMWNNSLMPWRRSPLWLLIRVTLQLLFVHEAPSALDGISFYKSLMLFFTASLLEEALNHCLPSEIIEIMRSKVVRRKHKLTALHGQNDKVTSFADRVMTEAAQELILRQSNFIKHNTPVNILPRLRSLDFASDSVHRLEELNDFIGLISQRKLSSYETNSNQFTEMASFDQDTLPHIPTSTPGEYTEFFLAEVETWVSYHLDSWLHHNITESEACAKLLEFMTAYKKIALPIYRTDPEGLSIMVLALTELWIACDKIAKSQIPLMCDYDPRIPSCLFQSLLLPSRDNMRRLAKVEQYLRQRSQVADQSLPDIFTSFGGSRTFAVRYYGQSAVHQRLLGKIEAEAARSRTAKIAELSNVQAQHERLRRLYEAASCECLLQNKRKGAMSYQGGYCTKCSYKRQMNSLNINIFEWPLPRNQTDAQNTVFELCPPCTFSKWRDATAFIHIDVSMCKYGSTTRDRVQSLESYSALRPYFKNVYGNQRIGLWSSTKPNARTHRRLRAVPYLEVHDVCLNNGMTYYYFDDECTSYVTSTIMTEELVMSCTFKVPPESKVLQKYLFRPSTSPDGLPPNDVIAHQAECPAHLSTEEYKSLCLIPLGHKIQWLNILHQLAMPSINFGRAETAAVILQAMYQAGPPSSQSELREAHFILDCPQFCMKTVNYLQQATDRVRNNWESTRALSIFISVATRTLSLSNDKDVQFCCLKFLLKARAIAFTWLAKIRTKATGARTQQSQLELKQKSAEIALICLETFDIQMPYFESFFKAPGHASIFLQSCIAICECLAADSADRRALIRWRKLCHRAHAILIKSIVSENGYALDLAIQATWPEYSRGIGWKTVSPSSCNWLETATKAVCGHSLAVHFNVLTGELLVNGAPLSRLPSSFESHPMFKALFGGQALDVMPSNIPGMQFSVKQALSDNVLNIGLQPQPGLRSRDLIVSAKKLVGKKDVMYHLIPSRVFSDKIPTSFVQDYFHWYDTHREVIELRPRRQPWETPRDPWIMRSLGKNEWKFEKLNQRLVSPLSSTGNVMKACLEPIEDIEHIHLMLEGDSGILAIELPRLDLGFTLKASSTKLRSRQFIGMHIDSDQSIGCLSGLSSKLLLTNNTGSKRAVIIPDGDVTWRENRLQPQQSHVTVTITKGTASLTHFYNVDTRLGRLEDNGSFRSKIYLAYLHGLTSFAVPDTMTGYTGTEQALSILRSSAVRSTSQLTDEDLELLRRISRLTPSRHTYPRGLDVMQQVQWLPGLSFLSQSSHYYIEILRILEHADNQKAFYYDKRPSFVEQLRDAQSLNPKLIKRDCVNNAWVRSPEFGADGFTTLNDRVYASRDRGRSEPGKDDCFAMSRVIHSGEALLAGDPGTGLHNRLWQFFRDRATVYGPNHEQPLSSLSFDSVWLQDLSSTFAEQWCWMHKMLSCRRSDLNRFHLMSWLSAIAFAAKARHETVKDLGILQVLLALAVDPNMADILPPPIDRFELASGYMADVSVIRAKVRISCISSQSRRGNIARELPQEPHESSWTYKWRCEQYFEQCQGRAVNSLTKLIHGQWPCEHPDLDMSILPKAITSYIDVPSALSEVSRQFQTWYNNHLFYRYLGKIAQVTEKLKIAPSLRLPNPDPAPTDPASSRLYLARDGFTSVTQLFAQNQPLLHFTQARPALQIHQSARASKNPFSARKHSLKVHSLTERLKLQASSDFQKRYAADLRESTEALEMMSNEQTDLPQDLEELKLKLEEYRDTCARYSGYLLSIIKKSIGAHDLMGRVTRPMPRITPRLFISQLAAHRWELLPDA